MARRKQEVGIFLKHPGLWSLYIVKDGKTNCLIKDTNLESFLNIYFKDLEKSVIKYPDIEPLELLEKYKTLWSKFGKVISIYNDSWSHKWSCFPSNTKIINYLTPRINDILSKQSKESVSNE